VTTPRTTESAASDDTAVFAVLFDLDGVLVDSLRVVERAWRRWAAEHQVEVDDVLAAIHGRTAREVVAVFVPDCDVAEQAKLVSSYERLDDGELTPMPGAGECVALASRGSWAIVTSGTRKLALARLNAVGLPVPEIMITADDVAAGKPDPEPYRLAAKTLEVEPAQCVVVEDAPMGILAAKRAGMTVLAVTSTHEPAALDQADLVFASMHDITAWLRDR
jgi:sugar-phosphatase